jgi:hypothetical protein
MSYDFKKTTEFIILIFIYCTFIAFTVKKELK